MILNKSEVPSACLYNLFFLNMEMYNVMVTQANTKLGFEFVRQLVALPCPPEYVFASYTDEDPLKDLLNIRESSKKSKVVIIKMDCQVFDDICEVKATVEHLTGNRGLNFLINIISFTNHEDRVVSKRLERQFQTYTLSQLLLFQVMKPLLTASECIQESKAVFYNITEDNSLGSDSVFEINKVALNLCMDVLANSVLKEDIVFLSTCLNTEEESHNEEKTEIENTVRSMLLHAFLLFSGENPNSHTIQQP